MNSLNDIAELIKKENDFIISSHVGPDGDSLGATLALGHVLKMLKKNACLSFGEDSVTIPSHYRLLDDIDWLKSYKSCNPAPVFISLECPQQSRLGGSYKLAKKAKHLINIDHHGDNRFYGTHDYVNSEISSTCEILFNLFNLLDVKLNKKIATYLYIGIVTDTGRFQYSNTSPQTFQAAKKLLEFGVDANYIFQYIYENRSAKSLKLLGITLAKAKIDKKGFIYSTISKEDFALSEVRIGETEDFIDFLRSVKNIKLAAILKESNSNEIKVSLRSQNNINVAKIAEAFGGGGHAAAAGYTSKGKIPDSIINLKKEINKYL